MDIKETLTRWARAYMEPSLFYVPAKKNKPPIVEVDIIIRFTESFFYENDTVEAEVYIMNGYRTSSIVGAIFTTDGKFVEYVSVDTETYAPEYKTKLKKGTYIFKEAVSPKGCLLADDTIFTVDHWEVKIKHKRNGFKVGATLEESEDHKTDYKVAMDDERIEVITSDYEIRKRYNVFYNFYSLYDNSLIRKIEDARFEKGEINHGLYKPNISDLGYILPFINDGNGTFILHTQNNEARFGRFGKFEYIESTKYKKYSRNLITLSFLSESRSKTSYNSSWGIKTDKKFYFQGGFSTGQVVIEDHIDYKYIDNLDPNDLDNLIKFVRNLTEEQLMDIYQFAINNVTPKVTTTTVAGKYRISIYSRYVWIGEDGTYYSNAADADYYHSINVITVASCYFGNSYLPTKIMFTESKNISDSDLLDDYGLIYGNDYKYQHYFLHDCKDDTSIYFHGINGDSTYDDIINNPLIEIRNSTFQVFTEEFTDTKLLAEINSYKKDGE